MKKTSIILFASALAISALAAATVTIWKYDKGHQRVSFSVSHMTVSDVEGYFKDVDATITCPGEDFTDAKAEMTIQVASIDTDNEKRDADLKGAGYFDVAKYPTITFKSTSFKKAKMPNAYMIKGDLTIHGVKKQVQLAAVAKSGVNPYSKKNITGFKLFGKINRKDYGIGESTPESIVGANVTISINAEFIQE